MCRALVAYLLSFSLLVLNPALPRVYGQSSGQQDQTANDSGYWSMPPDHEMAQAYPPEPNYGGSSNAPYGGNPSSGASSPYGDPAASGPNGNEPEYDPADRDHGVARLSIADGEVNVRRGDTGEAVAGAINAPLLTQDHVETSPNGRAEVELDSGDAVRLAPSTALGFADLRYHRAQIQLGLGTVLYRVLRPASNDVEIDTPSVGVRAAGTGEFRISVYDDGTTQVTVRSGRAEVLSANGREPLNPGQSLLIRGDSSHVEYQWVSAPAFDQLEAWSRERDRQLLASQSYRYVNPDVDGADDLDRYGSWVGSQYGQVWQPQTPSADWAPYSNGDWTYEPYYGWTWVDAAPWGWAPYHYGRWFYNDSRGWCWWPGSVGAATYWSPALVGFFGIGAGLAWVALAPFERFHPWWGSGYRGGGFGGYGYRGGVWGAYRNAGFRGGAIFASRGQFGLHNVRYGFADRNQLAHASFIGGRIPVTPGRTSFAFSNRTAFANQRFSSVGQRGFFGSQQAAHGGFVGSAGVGRSGYYGGNARGAFGAEASRSQGAWHSFGDPGHSPGVRQNFTAQAPSSGGWHNFGQAGHGSSEPNASYAQRPAQNWQQHGQAPSGRSFSPSYSQSPRPSWGNSNGGYHASGGGFGSYQAPRYSAPSHSGGGGQSYGANTHTSQPHVASGGNRGGGYSGGGSHASGGSHSSGGGGHHR